MCSICCFVVRPPHCTRIISAPPSAPTDLLSHVLALVHRRLSGVTRLPPSHAPGRRRCRRAAIALRTGPGGPGARRGREEHPVPDQNRPGPAPRRRRCGGRGRVGGGGAELGHVGSDSVELARQAGDLLLLGLVLL